MPETTSTLATTLLERVPKPLRLESIKSRIVGLAMAAALIPSMGTAWVSYVQNRASLTAKTAEELRSTSEQTAREIDLWLKERLYDIRVFGSSYEVTENIERARRSPGREEALARLAGYLTSVAERFPDYTELLVFDAGGQRLASSAQGGADVQLPAGWLEQVADGQSVLGDPFWDEGLGQPLMAVAVPVVAADRTFMGAFVANVTYRALLTTLLVFAPGDAGDLYVIAPNGDAVVVAGADSTSIGRRMLASAAMEPLFANEGSPVTYVNGAGRDVIGTLKRVPRLGWAVVAEIPTAEAYAQALQLRDLTGLVLMGLLLVVGFTAYRLGLRIVRPLDRLAEGAAEVAAGQLEVDLPVGKGEVGYVTSVFNEMVERLREGRKQLEWLSVTDPLTGVSNRRHMMDRLHIETTRARRTGESFAALMVDVDHFKKFNDTHGHVAGDGALKSVAVVLEEATREVDSVSRYGGEEFLVVLPDTDLDGAVRAGERIRSRLAEHPITVAGEPVMVTLSIGAAECPTDGDSPDALIAAADSALYEAKRRGRDRVVSAERSHPKKKKKKTDGA